jgi:hypothetical protein
MLLKFREQLSGRKAILNSVFNTGRNLVNPLFTAVISYVLIKNGLQGDLHEINKITALVNLLLIFSGWGLRDYLFKSSSRPHSEFTGNWTLAFFSKFILLAPLIVVSFFCVPQRYFYFIIVLCIFKTFNALYESMVVLNKRNLLYFTLDFLIAMALIILTYAGMVRSYVFFFYLVLASEIFKTLFNAFLFRKPSTFILNFRALMVFLGETKFYFLIVLVSFFQSRIDLYLLGFVFDQEKLNEYQLLLSLVSLTQVVIYSFVTAYSKLFYRNINSSQQLFKKIVFATGYVVSLFSGSGIYILLNFLYGFDFSVVNIIIIVVNINFFARELLEMFYYIQHEWINAMLKFIFISGVINLAAGSFLIPMFGLSGAFGSQTISIVVLALIMKHTRIKRLAGSGRQIN